VNLDGRPATLWISLWLSFKTPSLNLPTPIFKPRSRRDGRESVSSSKCSFERWMVVPEVLRLQTNKLRTMIATHSQENDVPLLIFVSSSLSASLRYRGEPVSQLYSVRLFEPGTLLSRSSFSRRVPTHDLPMPFGVGHRSGSARLGSPHPTGAACGSVYAKARHSAGSIWNCVSVVRETRREGWTHKSKSSSSLGFAFFVGSGLSCRSLETFDDLEAAVIEWSE
jgi:hypothetical protein